jgi:hypothetical protein
MEKKVRKLKEEEEEEYGNNDDSEEGKKLQARGKSDSIYSGRKTSRCIVEA